MKRLICFDLDGTLTQHRSPLEDENRAVLDLLKKKYKIIMVGAGNAPRIYAQMGEYPIDIIGNYGMQEGKIIDGKLTIVRETVTHPNKEFFLKNIEYLRKKYGYTEYKGDTVEFHSTGMVTFPLLGTKADIADKIAFDPTREKRRVLYPEVLEIFKDYAVYMVVLRLLILRKRNIINTTQLCRMQKKTAMKKTKFYTLATILATAVAIVTFVFTEWTL